MNLKRLLYLILLLAAMPTLLMAQPANDSCSTAVPVMMNEQVFFSSLGATSDGPFHPNSPCPTSASDSIFSDIWFVHTAEFTGEIRWSLCGSADFDSRIAAYNARATCPLTDGDLLDCNEDGPAACTNSESELDFDVVEGESYLLRLGGFGAAEPGAQGTGSFTITIAPAGPPNDDCADAIAIDLGTGQTISTTNATTDGPAHPSDLVCFGFGDDNAQFDVWYTFTSPVTSTIEWSTCGLVNWDSRLVVYGPNISCTDAGPVNTIACSDATPGCAGYTNILQFDAEEGVTYLMRIGGFGGASGSGVFDLVETIPPIPPDNDLCNNPELAWLLTEQEADDFDVTFQGTTINATVSGALIDPTCGNGQGGKYPDVWFKFNNLGNDTVEVRYFAESPGSGFILEILENCDGDTILAGSACYRFSPDDNNILVDTITGLSSDYTEYYIRIAGWLFWTPGNFFFQLVAGNTVGNKEVIFPGQFEIAPNPVTDQLQLDLRLTSAVDTKVQIVNIFGQTVMEKEYGKLSAGTLSERYETGGLASGVYTLMVRAGGARKAMKFTKI